MTVKLHDSELKVMDTLWREGELPARRVADILGTEVGWNVNTTYTPSLSAVSRRALSSARTPAFSAAP